MKQQEGKMQRQTLAFSGFKAPPPELALFYCLGAEILAAAQLLHLLKHPAPTRTPPSTRSTPTGNMQDAPSDICFTHKDPPHHQHQSKCLTPRPGSVSLAELHRSFSPNSCGTAALVLIKLE